MKPSDQTLQRLLDAAAKVRSEPGDNVLLGMEGRVLANWRAGREDDESASLFAFFRHAMVGASLVLILSAAWSLSRPAGGGSGDEAALLDHDIQISLDP
jgi:hypothetical protein